MRHREIKSNKCVLNENTDNNGGAGQWRQRKTKQYTRFCDGICVFAIGNYLIWK